MPLPDPRNWQSRPVTGGGYAVTEPATGDTLGHARLATAADVAPAAEAAVVAQRAWARVAHVVRAGVLRRAGDLFTAHSGELRTWLVRESGSVPGKADFELHVAAQECYEAAGSSPTSTTTPPPTRRRCSARSRPYGPSQASRRRPSPPRTPRTACPSAPSPATPRADWNWPSASRPASSTSTTRP
ncbi:aldehyde dehydrogenase family protein [Streptomyces chromofuscus]|uniref:aldehyde dehydrogenase family protein n=1 Tax=Streptomyces chromofuscus TaxID=42881 RepID=UPI00357174DB